MARVEFTQSEMSFTVWNEYTFYGEFMFSDIFAFRAGLSRIEYSSCDAIGLSAGVGIAVDDLDLDLFLEITNNDCYMEYMIGVGISM
ncbi:hypothetical protein K8T06_04090 [bacterium]|nr:hypothetical protein [bacterium]